MMKITELTEKRFRTTHKKDAFGNRVRGKEEYIAKRTVRTVKSGPRFGHFFVDMIFFQLLIMMVQFFLTLIHLAVGIRTPIGVSIAFVSSIVAFLLYPFMYFLCEYLWQQTPGKLLTKTIVINEYGNKADIGQIALRSLIRLVPFEAFSCLDDYSRGWHDKWSDTFVVKKEELEKLKILQEKQSSNRIKINI